MDTYIQSFGATNVSLDIVGGKGLSLSTMTSAGFDVPPGFTLATSAYQYCVNDSLQSRILELTNTLGANASSEIQLLFEDLVLGDQISESLLAAYDALGAKSVAVRSSANAEDLPDLSFAGQQDTYLNIAGHSGLLEAVKQCWASLWNPRAIEYRNQMGIDHDVVAMAVVVQEMVPSEVSGILFTANPATGERDELIINASFGLGEAIVGGHVSADTFVLDRHHLELTDSAIGDKKVQIISAGNKGTREVPVTADMQATPALSQDQMTRLGTQALTIERLFGGQPIDIEWAIRNDAISLLQARPITNLPPPPLKDITWTPREPGDYLMRQQVVEFMPGPLSPLFEELYLPAVDEGFALRRDWIDGTTDGLERAANYKRRGNETINGYAYRYMGNARQRRQQTEPAVVPREKRVSIDMVSWVCHEWPRRWRHEKLPRYLATIEQWRQVDVDTANNETLLEGICALTKADAHYWEAANSVMALPRWQDQALQDFLKKHAPGAGFTSGMLLDASDSLTMRAQVALWQIARLIRTQPALAELTEKTPSADLMATLKAAPESTEITKAITEYLGTYGHQIYSLDYVEPTPLQEPSPVMAALKTLVADTGYNPVDQQQEIRNKRREAIRTVSSHFNGKRRRQFRWRLFWAQRFYANRDEAQFFVGAAWPVLQRMALTLGRRLKANGYIEQADDVYFLKHKELQTAIGGESDHHQAEFSELARGRRELREARKRLVPPERIFPESADAKPDTLDDLLRGTAVSPGKITAAVSVIHSAADFDQMAPNTILVCPFTTPAWTQLFSHAVGLVTDIGSITSHGSIVAREYGIPAVLGLGNITSQLQTGQIITVDGDAGTVEVIDDTSVPNRGSAPAITHSERPEPAFEGLDIPLPFHISRLEILFGYIARPFKAAFYTTVTALVFWFRGPRSLL
ncbi:MAG: PEP/pyruvate-binding domain-containing protein [Pseudomonadota bacterium]